MRRYTLEIRGETYVVEIEETMANHFSVVIGDETYDVALASDEHLPEATIHPAFAPDDKEQPTSSTSRPRPVPASATVAVGNQKLVVQRAAAGSGNHTLTAPMPGVILQVAVKPGDVVKRGQEIAVLEAMKMQNSIKSNRDGSIAEVCVAPGQAVGHGDPLVRYAKG